MFLVDTCCQTQRLGLFNQPHLINPISWGGHIGLTRLIWCEQWTVLLLLDSDVQQQQCECFVLLNRNGVNVTVGMTVHPLPPLELPQSMRNVCVWFAQLFSRAPRQPQKTAPRHSREAAVSTMSMLYYNALATCVDTAVTAPQHTSTPLHATDCTAWAGQKIIEGRAREKMGWREKVGGQEKQPIYFIFVSAHSMTRDTVCAIHWLFS